MKSYCLQALFLFLFVWCCPIAGQADVGNFNDYSQSDYSSFSSSEYTTQSSSDYTYNSFPTDSFDSEYINRHNVELTFEYLLAFLFGIGSLIIFLGTKSAASYQGKQAQQWPDLADYTSEISLAMREIYPYFNDEDFLHWAKDVFMKLQTAWTARKWESVAELETPDLYSHHAQQIEEYKQKHEINRLENIEIKDAYLFSLAGAPGQLTLSVFFHVQMLDYIVKEQTDSIVKGTDTEQIASSYLYIFAQQGHNLTWRLSRIIPVNFSDTALKGGVLIERNHTA